MSTAKASTAVPSQVATAPVNIDDHKAEMELRREEQLKKRPKLLKCLDPTVAAEYERAKPIYEWKIEANIFTPATKDKRAGTEKYNEQVVAQNEEDAWALFCDKIGRYPSRRDTNPTITRLKQRTGDDD